MKHLKLFFSFIVFFFSILPLPAKATSIADLEIAIREAWKQADCAKAHSLMSELEASSSSEVFHFLSGEGFEFGHCVDTNIDKAISSYKKAFRAGENLGAMQIGTLYLKHKNDPVAAQNWFRTVAVIYAERENHKDEPLHRSTISKDLNDILPRSLFGDREFPEEEFRQELTWAKTLLQGPSDAIYDQALKFDKGTDGYPLSIKAASKLLQKAALRQHPFAAWHLAKQQLAEKSEGDSKSQGLLLAYLKTAGLGGIVDAQLAVAQQYLARAKNKYDYWSAYSWLVFARKNGASVNEEIGKVEAKIEPSRAQDIKEDIEEKAKLPR